MGSYDFPQTVEPAQFAGDSLLERVSRAYEEAVDIYGSACDRAADAENAYLREWAIGWARAVEDGVPATTRDKHVNAQPDVNAARQEWNRAQAAEKRCKAKATELAARMSAVQSHVRFLREGS